jgi:hypothetical protein
MASLDLVSYPKATEPGHCSVRTAHQNRDGLKGPATACSESFERVGLLHRDFVFLLMEVGWREMGHSDLLLSARGPL